MKKLAALLILTSSMLVYSQAPAPAKESTIAEMKIQLAQKDLTIAKMTQVIHQQSVELQNVNAALAAAFSQQAANDAAEIAAKQKAVDDATPKPVAAKK